MQQTKRFPIGAHLMVKHFGYTHHGIYAGRGRVIHYPVLHIYLRSIQLKLPQLRNSATANRFRSSIMPQQNIKAVKSFAVCVPECMKITIT